MLVFSCYVRLPSTAQSLSNTNRLVSRADKTRHRLQYYRCAYISEAVALAAIESFIRVCSDSYKICDTLTIVGTTHTLSYHLIIGPSNEHTNATRQILWMCVKLTLHTITLCAPTRGSRCTVTRPISPLRDCEHRGAARPRPRHWTTRLARWQASSCCQYEKKSAK